MSESARAKQIVTALAFVGVAAGVGGGGYWYMNHAEEQAKREAEEARREAEPETVEMGELYYVFAQTVEMAPRGLEGDTWDMDDSAPDVGYRIVWQGQSVFESTEKSDTLIARWSGMKLGLEDAFTLLKQGKADPSQIIDAALMRAKSKEGFNLQLYDSDLTGDESAGNIRVMWKKLKPGNNRIKSTVRGRGFVSVDLRVVPDSNDLFAVLKAFNSDETAP